MWSDTEAALKKYLAERDWLQAGEEPPADITGTSLADLCNQFLTAKQSRVHSGELTLATFNDDQRCYDLLIKAFGRQRPVERIGPSDFTRLRGVITSRYGPSRTTKAIVQGRMLFNWGHRQELTESPRFGPEFVKPSRDVLRRHRQSSQVRMFEADEIRLMPGTPNPHTRAWIVLVSIVDSSRRTSPTSQLELLISSLESSTFPEEQLRLNVKLRSGRRHAI